MLAIHRSTGVAAATGARMYKESSMLSERVGFASLGMEVLVAKQNKHWLQVRIAGVGDGWILRQTTNERNKSPAKKVEPAIEGPVKK